MNKIVNKLLLAGENFISEMHLRQPRFTYRACRPFTKNKQIIQNFKNRGNSKFIYQNELDEACFQHDLTWEILKIYLEQQLLIKYYVIKPLILLKTLDMMDVKEI